jgi:hypothetical protein
MTAGEGIFYGLVFLGFIYLYIQTRDRWSWKKIILWFVGGVAVLIALIYGYLFINNYFTKWTFIPYKPEVVSSLNGVTLGEKVIDAQFRTGAKKKKGDDSHSYALPSDPAKFFQGNKEGTIDRIGAWCSDDAIKYPNLYSAKANEILCGNSGQDIINIYGADKVRILCMQKTIGNIEATSTRAYDAIDYGVRYILITNSVSGIYVYPPNVLKTEIGESFGDCK